MDSFIYWIALKNVKNLGILKSKKLLEIFESPENIFKASPFELKTVKGIGDEIVKEIGKKDILLKEAEKEVSSVLKKGYLLITLSDDDYPLLLKKIPDPPLLLYVKGNLSFSMNNALAVIGTRTPDYYGKNVTFNICSRLARCNFIIVSGMARGIDTIAHKSAIQAGGRTIAVLGCGVDIAYPPENMELMEEISSNGAVISEYPPGTEPLAVNFPRRNRIISGLSRGVLVVQAKEKSGTFHTVTSALEQGREVYAVPGPIDKELSKGPHRLIKEGAKLVEDISDITEELGPLPDHELKDFSELSEDEELVLSLISSEPVYIDDIIRKSSMEAGKVSSILSILEIKYLIEKHKGNFFVRI